MPSSQHPVVDDVATLGDGRRLAYAVWGDPSGRPLFLFHGSPASRLFAPDPAATAEGGIRLITVDRPGFGRSDPKPGREILDWPDDVAELADQLGVAAFVAAGHSSGGPYALACAYRLPQRVERVALVSCIAPREELNPDTADDDAALTRRAQEDPQGAAAALAEAAGWLIQNPERFLELPRPEPDARLLQDEVVRAMMVATVAEAVRQGTAAYAWDGVLERRPWGFPLAAISTETVVFQGDDDRAVPLQRLPCCIGCSRAAG